MRITSQNFTETMVRLMQTNLQNVVKTQNQISTGKRLLQPSDDAVDTVKILHLNDELAVINQYQKNIQSVKGMLQQQDSIYSSINSLLARAKDILLQAANGTNNDENKATFANELESINEELVSLANYQTADGQYLFAGTNTTQQPITKATSNYTYNGNSLYREVEVSGSAKIQVLQPGDGLFFDPQQGSLGNIFDAFQLVVNELRTQVNSSSAITSALGWIDTVSDKVGHAQTRGGGDLKLLDNIFNSHQDITLFATELKSQLEDVDLIEAASRLSQQQVILSASQQVYVSTKQLSLFNYIQ